jgi:hypothetical protein
MVLVYLEERSPPFSAQVEYIVLVFLVFPCPHKRQIFCTSSRLPGETGEV